MTVGASVLSLDLGTPEEMVLADRLAYKEPVISDNRYRFLRVRAILLSEVSNAERLKGVEARVGFGKSGGTTTASGTLP